MNYEVVGIFRYEVVDIRFYLIISTQNLIPITSYLLPTT